VALHKCSFHLHEQILCNDAVIISCIIYAICRPKWFTAVIPSIKRICNDDVMNVFYLGAPVHGHPTKCHCVHKRFCVSVSHSQSVNSSLGNVGPKRNVQLPQNGSITIKNIV